MKKLDSSGRQFFRWAVLSHSKGRYWHCRCECGTERAVHQSSLLRGVSQSCGCWRREVSVALGLATKGGNGNRGRSRKHGEAVARTPEYRTWVSMHERCRNPDRADYGGRGISVCERWKSYDNFLAEMGRRPSKLHSLDRYPDNDGDYEPGNCRWATKKQQVDNRRKFGRVETFTSEELLAEVSRRNIDAAGLLSLPG
jgi:hypothetical protein